MIITKRKYQYEILYTIQGFYYGKWEDETTEEMRKDALERLKEYRTNQPEIPHRIHQEVTKTLIEKQPQPEPTPVIIRSWKKSEGGGWIALFPEIPADANGLLCQSYERIGQHGGASFQIIGHTLPATPEQIEEALAELAAIGHENLVIRKRYTSKMVRACYEKSPNHTQKG